MKVLEKFTLILYANIILIISILLCIMIFGWVDSATVGKTITSWLTGETSSKIILGISVIFIILSVKCIFSDKTSDEQARNKQGVLLQNENGKLVISKDTLENIVSSVAREHKEAQEIITSVELDRESNVKVLATIVVENEASIKDLSVKLQKEIKDRIKHSTDLDVKEVNIRVKNTVDTKPGSNASA